MSADQRKAKANKATPSPEKQSRNLLGIPGGETTQQPKYVKAIVKENKEKRTKDVFNTGEPKPLGHASLSTPSQPNPTDPKRRKDVSKTAQKVSQPPMNSPPTKLDCAEQLKAPQLPPPKPTSKPPSSVQRNNASKAVQEPLRSTTTGSKEVEPELVVKKTQTLTSDRDIEQNSRAFISTSRSPNTKNNEEPTPTSQSSKTIGTGKKVKKKSPTKKTTPLTPENSKNKKKKMPHSCMPNSTNAASNPVSGTPDTKNSEADLKSTTEDVASPEALPDARLKDYPILDGSLQRQQGVKEKRAEKREVDFKNSPDDPMSSSPFNPAHSKVPKDERCGFVKTGDRDYSMFIPDRSDSTVDHSHTKRPRSGDQDETSDERTSKKAMTELQPTTPVSQPEPPVTHPIPPSTPKRRESPHPNLAETISALSSSTTIVQQNTPECNCQSHAILLRLMSNMEALFKQTRQELSAAEQQPGDEHEDRSGNPLFLTPERNQSRMKRDD